MNSLKKDKKFLDKIINEGSKKFFQFLCSLKLAFFTFISLIIILGFGTYIESRYDTEAAQVWVYRSSYLYFLLLLLIINLFAVMLSRWPWKKRHTGFLLAHMGIIIILIGALLTYQMGVDGSIYLPLGGHSKSISIASKEFSIFSSFTGKSYTLLYQDKVNFLTSPPQKKPRVFPLRDNKKLMITHYHHFSLRKQSVIPSENPISEIALKFQLWNHQVNEIDWIFLKPSKNRSIEQITRNGDSQKKDQNEQSRHKGNFKVVQLGPAQIILNEGPFKPEVSGNAIVFYADHLEHPKSYFKQSFFVDHMKGVKREKTSERKKDLKKEGKIFYEIHKLNEDSYSYKSSKKKQLKVIQAGWVGEGDVIKTGWMDLSLRLLRFLKKAKVNFEYEILSQKTEQSVPSLQLSFDGETYNLGLNSFLRIFTENEVYVLSFANQQINLDFNIHLKDFNIRYYPGTKKAMSYESDVLVEGKKYKISMNKPLKYKGFTFYQSSFQENENKEIIASILTVNKDPGRFLKYLGTVILVIGTLILFYFKKPVKKFKN